MDGGAGMALDQQRADAEPRQQQRGHQPHRSAADDQDSNSRHACAPRLPDEAGMIKDRQTKESERPVTRNVKVFSTIAVQSALEALVPPFETANGCRPDIAWK